MDKLPGQCPLCWTGGKPVQWTRGALPSTKRGLVEALIVSLPNVSPVLPLDELSKEELKHIYQEQVRGKRIPSDPTYGMSSLKKPELLDRVQAHGLQIPQGGATKGQLMTMLREHWAEQCHLATSGPHTGPSPGEAANSEGWDFVDSCPVKDQEAAMQSVQESIKDMMEATTKLYHVLGENTLLRQNIENSLSARSSFCLSVDLLIAKSSQK